MNEWHAWPRGVLSDHPEVQNASVPHEAPGKEWVSCPGKSYQGQEGTPHHGQIWNEGGYKKKISNNFRKGQGDGRPLEDAEVSWAPLKVSGTQGLGNGNEGIWFMTTVFTEPLSHATLFQEPQMF